jgi:transcriptional regulator with XRE-family HTH domain
MTVLLSHWREHRGYSVRELARRARVGYVTIVRIENGHMSPTVTMLEKLAKALGIDVRDFFPPRRKANRANRRRQ